MLSEVYLPHNRFDLAEPHPVPHRRISVVIVHFEQHDALQRTCHALAAQTQPPEEIVVADDGSATAPDPDAGAVPVTVVVQENRGFRAAAARNLGARHARGELLVFLDADTSPEPEFLHTLTRTVARAPDVLAVGRRRYAALSALPPSAPVGGHDPLPEPAWLSDGYSASRDLLDADGRSFRFVISAAFACRATLFADLDGFDESFTEYGGEDWDLAYRAWNNGAVLMHEPAAVAWHDGPEWSERGQDPAVLRGQTMRLAALIPEPGTRGVPLPMWLPDVVVDLAPQAWTAQAVDSLLLQSFRDLRVRLPEAADPLLATLFGPAVSTAAWSPEQLRRCRARLLVHAPLEPSAVERAMDLLVADDLGVVEVADGDRVLARLTSTRCLGRIRRWSHRFGAEEIERSFGTAQLRPDETLPLPPPRPFC